MVKTYISSNTLIQSDQPATVFRGTTGAKIVSIANSSVEVAHIGQDGEYRTPIVDVESKTRFRASDCIGTPNGYVNIWDELCGLKDVVQNGRWIEVPAHYSQAIKLYLDNKGYSDMSMREFLSKIGS